MTYEDSRAEEKQEEAFLISCATELLATQRGKDLLAEMYLKNMLRDDCFGREFCKLILRIMPYKQYLQTRHWKMVAARARHRANNRCQLCNCPDSLEVHHRTYEHRGHEHEADLTVLCDKCHGKFHGEEEPE